MISLVNGKGDGVTDAAAFRTAINAEVSGAAAAATTLAAILTVLGVTSYADNAAATGAVGAGRIYYDVALGYLAISA